MRIKDGENDFKLLSNTSKCIDWTIYSNTLDLSIDETTFDSKNPSDIYFDGVPSENVAGVVTSLKAMFSNLAGVDLPSYKSWVGLISQTGVADPTAIVLNNDIVGTITLSRVGVGTYSISNNDGDQGQFIEEKTFFFFGQNIQGRSYSINRESQVELTITTYDPNGDGTFTILDELLDKLPVEIRVYP